MTKDEVKRLMANVLPGRDARAIAKRAHREARAAARGLAVTRATHAVVDPDNGEVLVVTERTTPPKRPSRGAGTWKS